MTRKYIHLGEQHCNLVLQWAVVARTLWPSQRSVLEMMSWWHRHICCHWAIPAQEWRAASGNAENKGQKPSHGVPQRSLFFFGKEVQQWRKGWEPSYGVLQRSLFFFQERVQRPTDWWGVREKGLYGESRGWGRATGPVSWGFRGGTKGEGQWGTKYLHITEQHCGRDFCLAISTEEPPKSYIFRGELQAFCLKGFPSKERPRPLSDPVPPHLGNHQIADSSEKPENGVQKMKGRGLW